MKFVSLIALLLLCHRAEAKETPEHFYPKWIIESIGETLESTPCPKGTKTERADAAAGTSARECIVDATEKIRIVTNSAGKIISVAHLFTSTKSSCSKQGILDVYSYPKDFESHIKKDDNGFFLMARNDRQLGGRTITVSTHITCSPKNPNYFVFISMWK